MWETASVEIICRRVDPILTASLPARMGFFALPDYRFSLPTKARVERRELRIALQVTIEARLSAALPVAAAVIVNSRPRAQHAEKLVSRWANDNSDVSVPDDKVRRLGVQHAPKAFCSVIKIFGVCVGVGKTGTLVDRVNKVRAIASRVPDSLGVQRNRNHGRLVGLAQRPLRARAFRGRGRINTPGRLLRRRHQRAAKTERANRRDRGLRTVVH
jgi:hypothetical protein